MARSRKSEEFFHFFPSAHCSPFFPILPHGGGSKGADDPRRVLSTKSIGTTTSSFVRSGLEPVFENQNKPTNIAAEPISTRDPYGPSEPFWIVIRIR